MTPAVSDQPRALIQSFQLLVVAVLGAGLPIALLKAIDSLNLIFSPAELARVISDAALIDFVSTAVASGIVAFAAALLGRILRVRFTSIYYHLSLGVSRFIVAAYFIYALIHWLFAVDLISYVPLARYWLVIALPAFVGSVLASITFPRPGRVLANLRPIAACFFVMALLALPLHWLTPSASKNADKDSLFYVAPEGGRPKHIILLTIDTLSAQHMSLYGATRSTSPRLDQFARTARVFERFYANGNWTTPGMSSLATGARPWTTRAGVGGSSPILESARVNLVEMAERAGYRVGSFVSNPNGASARLNIRNSAVTVSCTGSNVIQSLVAGCLEATFGVRASSFELTFLSRMLDRAPNTVLAQWRSGDQRALFEPRLSTGPALRWLSENRDAATFLWLHLLPPHDPYAPPPPFLGNFESSADFRTSGDTRAFPGFSARGRQATLDRLSLRYDEAIRYVDARTGDFLDALHADPEFRDATIIITADHGESFHHEFGSHGGLRLPEEVIHIPFMISGPGIEPGRDSTPAQQVDLLPTLARIMSLRFDDSGKEGHALAVTASGVDAADSSFDIFSMSLEQVSSVGKLNCGAVALVRDRYKYIHYFGMPKYPSMPSLQDELYDIIEDPGEDRELSLKMPNIAAQMRADVVAEIARHH